MVQKVKKLEQAGGRVSKNLPWLPITCYFHGVLIGANSDDYKYFRLLFTIVTPQLFVMCLLKLFLTFGVQPLMYTKKNIL